MVLARKRFWFIIIVAGALLFWKFGYQRALFYFFNVSGTVSISSSAKLPKRSNTMLIIVARNENGIPVAVNKIINPVLPFNFKITRYNLIYPDLMTKNVFLDFYFNKHGQIGLKEKDDLIATTGKFIPMYTRDLKISLQNVN